MSAEKVQTSGGDAVCQRCGQENPVWFADNDLWNSVMGDEGGILCPPCFIKAAELAGVVPPAWHLQPGRRLGETA